MIPGTSYSPSKAFIAFAREFFEALAVEDYQAALSKFDVSAKSWSKKNLVSELKAVIGTNSICSAKGFTQSASPVLEQTESGYILEHRLPVQGKWAKAKAIFEFVQKPNSDYYSVVLRGFMP